MITYTNEQKYDTTNLNIDDRRTKIKDFLRNINLPTKSKKAYNEFNTEIEISYRTWQRDIRQLAKINKIDILVQKGGIYGCTTIITGNMGLEA